MAEVIDVGDEDGYATIRFGGAEVNLDLVGTWEKFQQHQKANEGLENYTETLVAFVQGLGFPPCSQRVAIRIMNLVAEQIEAVKKNDLPAASPGETSPEPAGSMASSPAT